MPFTRRDVLDASAALLGAGLTATLGTRASAQSNDTIRIAFAARNNRTLDPSNSIQGADNWSIVHIHDTLVASPNGRFAERPEEFVPQLAESWTMSPDARTWTFVPPTWGCAT